MTDRQFVHLHLHTQYSLLDGACRLNDLVSQAKAHGSPAMAITDHGNLFGAVKFYKKATKAGLRPIIGCEAYVADGSRFDQAHVSPGGKRPYTHLVLLCENEKGYKNLCKLSTAAFLEGFSYKPRMDKELLRQHSEGLIALSACLGGEVPQKILRGQPEEALRSALELKDIFGEGNFFLELQDQGLPEQAEVNRQILDLHRETGIPLVATNDVHFLRKEDFDAHNVLLAIQMKTTLEERKKSGKMAYSPEHYLKSPAEMWDRFGDHPDALENTVAIGKRCHFGFDTQSKHYPVFKVPEGETLTSYFVKVAREGYQRRVAQGLLTRPGSRRREDYEARLDEELGLIEKMDLAGYFLVVWDFIRYAVDHGIPVGPGRGSAAGSFVSYSMGITDIDPLRYDLLFERFLNPERVSMPDIDIDFCMRGRAEVISYVTEKYGRDNVAQIITFGEMKARLAIRDVGRALGVPLDKVDKVAKAVPEDLGVTIEEALKQSLSLKSMYDADPEVRGVLDVAQRLEGLTRHASTHAAGVVIAPKPITEFCPLHRGSGGKEDITTQYSKDEIESLGLLKMDFLGLKTLTILSDTLALIRRSGLEPPDLSTLPLDDAKTMDLFVRGDTDGVFQFESGGMKDILRQLKPARFEDLIALNALYRPGPLDAKMIPKYIARAHGREDATVPLQELEPILKETLGVIVYQEQVMLIAHKIGGFTLGQADILRKAIAKKDTAAMQVQRELFMKGCAERKVDAKKAADLFDAMETFGRYGFNKSHSAAYALVAFQTAYLKAHFPTHFMAATLSVLANNTDEVLKYMNSCREMGIRQLPPDVNRSEEGFTIEGDAIRYGLGAIKNVGLASVEAILDARRRVGAFKDLFHFCREVDRFHVNRRVLENLAQSGAMDAFGVPRWDLVATLDGAMGAAAKEQEDKARGQVALFGGDEVGEAPAVYLHGEPWHDIDKFGKEKESLGFYLTGHPLMEQEELLRRYASHTLAELERLPDATEVTVGGVVASWHQKKSKAKGEMYGILALEDLEARAEVMLFTKDDVFNKYHGVVVKDAALLVVGKVARDTAAAEGQKAKVKIIASMVVPFSRAHEELEQKATAVVLRVPALLCEHEWLVELEAVLRRHAGGLPVLLDVVGEGNGVTRVMLGGHSRVRAGDAFLADAAGLLGKGRVQFQFRQANGAGRDRERAKR